MTTAVEVEVKERQMIFGSESVRAILEGRKTQTRRVVKVPPWLLRMSPDMNCAHPGSAMGVTPCLFVCCANGSQQRLRNPYGWPEVVAVHLWVRESFSAYAPAGETGNWKTEDNVRYVYRADDSDADVAQWFPPIFLPRHASRLTLEIKNVRVERLQEISSEDCWAEGCPPAEPLEANGGGTVRNWFAKGWDSINGKRKGCAWESNPWVWVIEFKRL